MRFSLNRHPQIDARGRVRQPDRNSALPDRVGGLALILSLVGLALMVAFVPAARADVSGGTTLDPVESGPEPTPVEETPVPAEPKPVGNISAFNRPGMWIWYLSRSHGGSYRAIIRQAKAAGIGTLYIKSADGRHVWSQFTRSMVKRFQRAGLKVCGWHYVYGDHPEAEARASAAAARRGADCFVIDAEAEYEGKYASADRYVRVLRRLVGPRYPVALTGFPYVDYHPSFPYSVFLGPGAAQVNQPQMYWKTIGTSVNTVFEHTYLHNRLFKRPIRPLGQTYLEPPVKEVKAFRRYSQTYGAAPSWWSWQETQPRGWRALGSRTAGVLRGHSPMNSHATLRRGSRGDMVVWAQQHLKRKIAPNIPVTGYYGPMTTRAIRDLQRRRGLRADGVLGTDTWRRLLRFKPVRVRWWVPPRQDRGSARASAAAGRDRPVQRAPRSAALPAKGYEIPSKSARTPGLR